MDFFDDFDLHSLNNFLVLFNLFMRNLDEFLKIKVLISKDYYLIF